MRRDIVVIGASAGGSRPIVAITSALPASFPAAVLIARHVGAQESVLPDLLNLKGTLRAAHAVHGEILQPGRIYVAPPDRHLLVENDRVLLSAGPKENYARPAINPLFRSAAAFYGPRVVGVVLSGTLDDGAAGLKAIKERGGISIVQLPADAEYPSMPFNALVAAPNDYCLAGGQIAAKLIELAEKEVEMRDGRLPDETLAAEVAMDRAGTGTIELMNKIGKRSALSCPECGGALWKLDDEKLDRYRCHTGHAFSGAALEIEMDESLERALSAATRLLREREELARSLAHSAHHRGQLEQAERYATAAQHAADDAERLTALAKALNA